MSGYLKNKSTIHLTMAFTHHQKESARGYVAIMFATFLYGWFGVLTKSIGTTIPVYYQTFSRTIIMSIILVFILMITKQKIRINRPHDLLLIIVRSTFGFVNISTALIAFEVLPIGLAYILFFAGLLSGSFAIGVFVNREKLTKVKVISVVLTVCGVLLAYSYRTEFSGGYLPMILAGISGICVAFWNIIARYIHHDISATGLNCMDALLLTIFAGMASYVAREPFVVPTVSVAWLANYAMMGTFLLAGTLIPYGFRRVEAQMGSMLMPLEIVFGVMLGALLFQETLHASIIMGCIMIITASVLPQIVALRNNMRNRMR